MSDCFSPQPFKQGKSLMISAGSWQLLQMALVDFIGLPLSASSMPSAAVRQVYKNLHDLAVPFRGDTLPQAKALASQLQDYGQHAHVYFGVIARLLDQDNPDSAQIKQLLGNLAADSLKFETAAKAVAAKMTTFAVNIEGQASALNGAIDKEIAAITVEQGGINALTKQIKAETEGIHKSQQDIVHSLEAIAASLTYAWFFPIGTIIAGIVDTIKSVEIIVDMKTINKDKKLITKQLAELTADEKVITGMNGVLAINQKVSGEINGAGLQCEDLGKSWNVMAAVIAQALDEIKDLTGEQIKAHDCFQQADLAAAVNDWQDVANLAGSFIKDFYITQTPA